MKFIEEANVLITPYVTVIHGGTIDETLLINPLRINVEVVKDGIKREVDVTDLIYAYQELDKLLKSK